MTVLSKVDPFCSRGGLFPLARALCPPTSWEQRDKLRRSNNSRETGVCSGTRPRAGQSGNRHGFIEVDRKLPGHRHNEFAPDSASEMADVIQHRPDHEA